MSLYDQIAQGVRPIGADLPQVASMIEQKNRFQQLQAQQDEDRQFQRDRLRVADERQAQTDQAAAEKAHSVEAFRTAEWARASGQPRAALEQLTEVTSALDSKGIPWQSWTDEQADQFFAQVQMKNGPIAGIAPDSGAEPPNSFREFQLAQRDPAFGAFLDERGRGKDVNVNISQATETEANKAFGKLEGEAFSGLIERGAAAADKAATLRAMRDNPAITGPTQDVRAAATALFSDLGVPVAADRVNQLANLGQYKAIANQLVLSEQLKQKGPQTESDAKRIAESFGKTTNLQETNRLILNYQLALADRETLLAEKTEEYRQRTGKIDGWRKELRDYVQSTPLAAHNPKSGRLVFWNEFADAMREQNPGMDDEEIMNVWRQKYGGSR